MALRRLLEELCPGPYSPEIDEFCIILRIDGDLGYWGKEGCACMRRNRKGRYIQIDLYVPRQRWEGVSGIEIRRYFAAGAEDALRRMILKLHRDKTPVDESAMLRDFALVRERYVPHLAAVAPANDYVNS